MVLLLFLGCYTLPGQPVADLGHATFLEKDRALVEEILNLNLAEKESPISTLMVKVGLHFLDTPYVAHTLETDEEKLVINVREVDCTTFAEYCLALSKTIQSSNPSFEQFATQLQRIRYRNGTINGYPSRLHYFCDWIYNNQKKEIVVDLSKEIAHTPLPKRIDFMSTHPESYAQLKENPEWVDVIAKQEQEISDRETYYVPESLLPEVEGQFMEGDIVGITTGVKGLAISHVGILVKRSGRIHLLHASSAAGKVVVSENTLEIYLKNSKSATGVMVARPLQEPKEKQVRVN